jgi:hypothetical protein
MPGRARTPQPFQSLFFNAKVVRHLVRERYTANIDPRPIRVMLLDVPDRPEYRRPPDLSTLWSKYCAPIVEVGLPLEPPAVLFALHDPNRACGLTLKRCFEDDRDFHIGNLRDEQAVRNFRD